jgi:hypothetical protein
MVALLGFAGWALGTGYGHWVAFLRVGWLACLLACVRSEHGVITIWRIGNDVRV